jgi:hypothetical protein
MLRAAYAALSLMLSVSAAAAAGDDIWIARATLLQLPVGGVEWDALKDAAHQRCPAPDLADQHNQANTCVMAKALVAARLGSEWLERDVVAALTSLTALPTFAGRALSLGRQLPAYVIAADVIRLRDTAPEVDAKFRARLREWLTTPTSDGPASLIECHEQRANNWGTHCGASRIAIAAYLDDTGELARAARVFKGFLGDRQAYAGFKYGDLAWHCDPLHPVPINPQGCRRDARSLDGVIADDQRRAGGFRWPAPKENYVYEALQGAVAQAVLLDRAGYPAFEWEQRALQRAFVWLYDEAGYRASGDDAWQVAIINRFYGTNFVAAGPSRPGKNVGWAEWTHRP